MKPILAVALLAPCLLFSLLAGCCLCSPLGAQEGYRKPPSAILACITAARPPAVSLSPDRSHLLLSTRESMVSIAAQARPILRLAGRRIDPGSRGPQRGRRTTGFALLGVQTGETRKVELPDDVDLGGAVWTVDGKRFAFTNTRDDGIELWVCDAATATARKVPGITLVGTTGTPASWMPDQKTLLCRLVSDAGAPPQRPRAPKGPIVQESSGRRAPVRTYQDLLRDEHDVALYEFYVTSQLALVDPDTGTIKKIGAPGIYSGASASPDGRYLLIRRQHRPFSFLVTSRSFPQEIVVWDLAGNVVRKVTDMPLAENVPIGGVLTGRPTHPGTPPRQGDGAASTVQGAASGVDANQGTVRGGLVRRARRPGAALRVQPQGTPDADVEGLPAQPGQEARAASGALGPGCLR
ncbi:MAG: hypothetical protein ACYTF5_09645 [Planctomycetota bacterium]